MKKCHVKYGEKRWKTIVTVRHYGDRDSDGNHDGGDGNHDGGDGNHDGDGESSVTVGVNYGESGESDGEGDGENSVTVGVNYGEKVWNNFHRTFTVVHIYGESRWKYFLPSSPYFTVFSR